MSEAVTIGNPCLQYVELRLNQNFNEVRVTAEDDWGNSGSAFLNKDQVDELIGALLDMRKEMK